MKYLWLFSALGTTLLTAPAGCSPTANEQIGVFARDFAFQTLAAWLF